MKSYMNRILQLIVPIVLLLSVSPIRSADVPVPPPLGFSDWSKDDTEYHVIDFASGDISTIPRTGGFMGEPMGETALPDEIPLQSPYDKSVQIVIVTGSGGDTEESQVPTIYRIEPDGSRELILKQSILYASLFWSPNGRFFYVWTYDQIVSGWYVLYQYDIQAGILNHILLAIQSSPSCRQQWCVFSGKPQSHNPGITKNLYLLDENTGDLRVLAASEQPISTWWQSDATSFIYALPLSDSHQAVHMYYVLPQADSLITEFDARRVLSPLWSSDHRWLALKVVTGDNAQNLDLFVVDTQQKQPVPLMLTDEIDESVDGALMRWLSPDRIVFDVGAQDDLSFSLYTALLPSGQTHQAAEFSRSEGDIIDKSWSLDNRWLALSFYNAPDEKPTFYVVDGYGEAPLRAIPTDFPPADSICLGWFTLEQYAAGNANLCDFSMGIG